MTVRLPTPPYESNSDTFDVGTRELVTQFRRLGLLWEIKIATVQGQALNTNVTVIPVIFDGDTQVKAVTSAGGPIRRGARVLVMMVPPNNAYIIGTISANDINYKVPSFAFKTVLQSRTSNATPGNDNELFTTLLPNTFHKLEMQVFYVGNDVGDFRWRFTKPTGSLMSVHAIGIHPTVVLGAGTAGITEFFPTFNQSGTTLADNLVGASTSIMCININGIVRTGASGGTLQFQWSQSVSNGTATTVRETSWMLTTPIAVNG